MTMVPTRDEAVTAERDAIRMESPRYNQVGAPGYKTSPVPRRPDPEMCAPDGPIYEVRASQDEEGLGQYWLIYVPTVDKHTQARRVSEIGSMARDLIHVMTGEAPDSFNLDIQYILASRIQERLDCATELRTQADEVRREAAEEVRAAAADLKQAGVSLRDIGKLLGISFQRAGQLTSAG